MAAFNGSGLNDFIVGSFAGDVIKGYTGADTLNGNPGDDYIWANQGNDSLNGSSGNDTIFGGHDNDVIYGGQGNDSMFGDRGNDILYGNRGIDTLYGGEGFDIFVLSPLDGGGSLFEAEVIEDFSNGIDVIGLDGFVYGELGIFQDVNSGETVITEVATGRYLAVLRDVNRISLGPSNFVEL